MPAKSSCDVKLTSSVGGLDGGGVGLFVGERVGILVG